MEQIISYALKTILCSGLFYLLYRLLFDGRVNYPFCRIYLVSSLAAAAVIPALAIPVWQGEVVEVPLSLLALTQLTPALPEAAVVIEPEQGLAPFFLAAYGAVSLLFLIAVFRQLVQIREYRKHARRIMLGDVALYECHSIKTPFTFFRSIFIPEGLPETEKEQIITHELSHARHNHSLELVWMEILKAAFWFNPFIWLNRKALAEVHEYEADSAVIEKGHDPYNYKNLLFRQLFGYSPDISNGLACARTKKRFTMIDKQKPGRRSTIRAAAVLPVAGALLMLFSFTEKDASIIYIDDSGAECPFEIPEVVTADTLQQPFAFESGNVEEDSGEQGRELVYDFDPEAFRQQFANARISINGTDLEEFRKMMENLNLSVNPDFRKQLEDARALMEATDTEEFRKMMENLNLSVNPDFRKQLEDARALMEATDTEEFRKMMEDMNLSIDLDFSERMKDLQAMRENFDFDFQKQIEVFNEQREALSGDFAARLEEIKQLRDKPTDGDKRVITLDPKNGSIVFIVDGKKTDKLEINEADIASISVLKDKQMFKEYGVDENATAIMLITTKGNNTAQIEVKKDRSRIIIEGEKSEMVLDGNNSPLVIIDGKKVDPGKLKKLNSEEDIEYITVLKDKAATEIYGQEGANGVVLVTTKKKTEVAPEED